MRQKIDINGVWSFQIDRKDEGERLRWHESGLPEPMEVNVPHIWQTEEAYVQYCGTAWYEKCFSYKESLDGTKQVALCFDAVDFEARIWLNGQFVGSHEGGFTPFELDITQQIVAGDNKLVVRVYDPQDNAEIPIGKQGSWYTRVSGIWQEVSIETRAATSVKHVHVIPSIDPMQIEAAVVLQGSDDQACTAVLMVTEHEQPQQVIAVQNIELKSEHTKHIIALPQARLWSPEQPQLYDLHVTLNNEAGQPLDQYCTYFGMRQVSYEEGHIMLNNKRLYIRAALDQAFYPDTIFSAPSDQWIIDEIKLAKQMGFNMLRKHIKVEIPRYLYWADRMGLLIWAETPNVIKWSAQSRKRFSDEMVAMIERDYNRPSIIIWSLYNEEWGLEWDLANDVEKQEHVKVMYDDIKQLDPTRLICDNSGWIHVKTDINDHHRYFTSPEQIQDWRADLDEYVIANPDQNYVKGYYSKGEPIIISEFGVWGLPSVKKLLDFYGKQPSWFENLGDDTHREDFKMPLNAFDKFEKYQFQRIFGDFEQLALHTQQRELRAVKSIIEEMRKREAINGYVVTEFTDIEWETNGWLDYTRGLKDGFADAADFNGALVVMIDNEQRNIWSGTAQAWDIVVSNHDQHSLHGKIEWEIVGTDINGEVSIEDSRAHFALKEAIQFTAPGKVAPQQLTLQLRLVQEGIVLAKNSYELTVSPEAAGKTGRIYSYDMPPAFTATLQKNGYEIVNSFEAAEMVVTSTLNTSVMEYYRQGGHVLFLAEAGDQLQEKDQFTFRLIYQGESWDRTSSFNYVDPDYFTDVPLHHMMGWEMEGLFPDYIVPFSNYNKLGGTIGRVVYMFGNEGITEKCEIVSGYFQGWLGQAGGSLLVQRSEQGSLTLTTWKLKGNYGTHPIATHIVQSLIEKNKGT